LIEGILKAKIGAKIFMGLSGITVQKFREIGSLVFQVSRDKLKTSYCFI